MLQSNKTKKLQTVWFEIFWRKKNINLINGHEKALSNIWNSSICSSLIESAKDKQSTQTQNTLV